MTQAQLNSQSTLGRSTKKKKKTQDNSPIQNLERPCTTVFTKPFSQIEPHPIL